MLCSCDPATKACSVCGVPDFFCGSMRVCSGALSQPFAAEAVQPQPPPAPDLARHDSPSFLEKVRNFATAAAQHVAAGMPMCSDAEIIRRHDICLSCEHLQNNACNLCGCPVARAAGYVSKLSWADQECPAGKWGKAAPA